MLGVHIKVSRPKSGRFQGPLSILSVFGIALTIFLGAECIGYLFGPLQDLVHGTLTILFTCIVVRWWGGYFPSYLALRPLHLFRNFEWVPYLALYFFVKGLTLYWTIAQFGFLLTVPSAEALLFIGILGPISEEFLFRGFLWQGIAQASNPAMATRLSALAWTLGHFDRPLFLLIAIFLCGLIFGEIRRNTRSIYLTIILHSIHNTVSLFLFQG